MINDLKERIFTLANGESFSKAVVEIYAYQAENNPVYKQFISQLGKSKNNAERLADIPFLPVEFFRDHKVVTGNLSSETVFESSNTTGSVPARHYVNDLLLYEKSFLTTFRMFYGDPSEYMISALLPSYTERENSSLVYMVKNLVSRSKDPLSGFYQYKIPEMIANIQKVRSLNKKTLLFGVSFALLDLAENQKTDLAGTIVMETGGMKGRRNEITRQELHEKLSKELNVPSVHSEYGMTELMSQAYSKGQGIFFCPPWMRILIRDPYDPLSVSSDPGATGGINIIDLANINSCCFIATSDLGRLLEGGGFEVLGRIDNSDIRGCNLMF